MKFYADRFTTDKNVSYSLLKILSIILMVAAIGIFIYFFISGNLHIHYLIAVGSLWIFISGLFLGLFAYLMKSDKLAELAFEQTSKQVKGFGWISLGAFYISGNCLSAGLIFLAQPGDNWRYSIIFFTGAILGMAICLYGLILRKITKQHFELKKQQQEIIEMLSEQKGKGIKDITGGVLLA